MQKPKVGFICSSCGVKTSKWVGKCHQCNQWNTIESLSNTTKKSHQNIPKKIKEITFDTNQVLSTGMESFDDVLGKGLVRSGVYLFGGPPGVGKSTLLLELANVLNGLKILYVSGEETCEQIALRCRRLNVKNDKLYVLSENLLEKVKESIIRISPDFLIIDSIQTLKMDSESRTNSKMVLEETLLSLIELSKERKLITFLVGHITKQGEVAGPKFLEHMVDVVLEFSGSENESYRILQSKKNRFGPTSEISVFEMNKDGLSEVKNTNNYFVDNFYAPGLVTTITNNNGSTIFLASIECLIVNSYGYGNLYVSGIQRYAIGKIIGIAKKHLGLNFEKKDIYINSIKNITVSNPESELSILMSLLSSCFNKTINNKYIFLGEVSLSGKIMKVNNLENKIKFFKESNFERVYIDKEGAKHYNLNTNINLIGVEHVSELKNFFT